MRGSGAVVRDSLTKVSKAVRRRAAISDAGASSKVAVTGRGSVMSYLLFSVVKSEKKTKDFGALPRHLLSHLLRLRMTKYLANKKPCLDSREHCAMFTGVSEPTDFRQCQWPL